MGRLDNKVAIITGASGGVGQVAAVVFAREGAKVVVASRNAEASEETVRMVREVSGEAMFHKTNVSNVEDVKNMVRTTIETYGKLDILYNNAAICIFEPLIESTEESFERMISTNLKGVWLSMKYSIPEMIKIGGGAIINTSSIVASAASRGSAIYAASKAGIGAMTRVAAVEYAAHNIRVNCIEPGAIATPMAVNVFKDIPGVMERIKRETPQGRLGKPEEIAQLALFLASDESSHITERLSLLMEEFKPTITSYDTLPSQISIDRFLGTISYFPCFIKLIFLHSHFLLEKKMVVFSQFIFH